VFRARWYPEQSP